MNPQQFGPLNHRKVQSNNENSPESLPLPRLEHMMGSWKEDKTPAVSVVKWFPFLKKGDNFAHFKEGVGIYYTHLMLTRYPSCSFLLGPSCMFNS